MVFYLNNESTIFDMAWKAIDCPRNFKPEFSGKKINFSTETHPFCFDLRDK